MKQMKRINKEVSNNFYSRLLGEMLSAFFLIFIINFGQSLGEVGIPVFIYIYNVNILTALWIGSWTFLAFLWMRETSLSANFFNLVITYKQKRVNRKEFWWSLPFQLIGGLFAATLIYLSIINCNDGDYLVMGGTTPGIKGLFINNPALFNIDNPIYAHITIDNGYKYSFAALQGLVNACAIVYLFLFNRKVDNKFGKGTALGLRYVNLIICIALTTILYANTTNWIRLLAPAILGSIGQGNPEFLLTTLVFICVQTIGLLIVYFMIKDKK